MKQTTGETNPADDTNQPDPPPPEDATPPSGSAKRLVRLDTGGRIVVVVMLVIWLIIFGAGTLINSEPYRNQLANWSESYLSWVFFTTALTVLVCWTPTNIALLSGAAGLLGVAGRYAGLHLEREQKDPPDVTNPWFSALLRSFFVYLLLVSGLLIVVESPFATPTQTQYLRLAGLLSLFSFLVNYSQAFFAGFLRYAADRLDTEKGRHKPVTNQTSEPPRGQAQPPQSD